MRRSKIMFVDGITLNTENLISIEQKQQKKPVRINKQIQLSFRV